MAFHKARTGYYFFEKTKRQELTYEIKEEINLVHNPFKLG